MTDFVMTAGLLSLLFVMVLQVGLALHVRNTLISCASEGARYGARLGATPGEGAARTEDLISSSLSPRYAKGVRATTETTEAGVDVVVVRVSAPLPVLGPYGPGDSLEVSGRAFAERQGVDP
ncbi:TadE family protein [Janibacter sp. GXQ6167]|uniref:TadE family protein n=1 Tax=Janibacter sp. GXQ6167 TaxID=3240791 RepID=UPI00352608AA